MPDLPTLTLSQNHYDRVVAAFPGDTLALKAAAYKAWLTCELIDYVQAVEGRRLSNEAAATLAAQVAAIATSLPIRPVFPPI